MVNFHICNKTNKHFYREIQCHEFHDSQVLQEFPRSKQVSHSSTPSISIFKLSKQRMTTSILQTLYSVAVIFYSSFQFTLNGKSLTHQTSVSDCKYEFCKGNLTAFITESHSSSLRGIQKMVCYCLKDFKLNGNK